MDIESTDRNITFESPAMEQLRLRMHRFLRGRGARHHDAEDAVQDALLQIWRSGKMKSAGWQQLQSYALTAAKHAFLNMLRSAAAKKRGGGQRDLSLDELGEVVKAVATEPAADTALLRKEEQELTTKAIRSVHKQYEKRGHGQLATALESGNFDDTTATSRDALATELGMGNGALRIALLRHRERCKAAMAALIETPAA